MGLRRHFRFDDNNYVLVGMEITRQLHPTLKQAICHMKHMPNTSIDVTIIAYASHLRGARCGPAMNTAAERYTRLVHKRVIIYCFYDQE